MVLIEQDKEVSTKGTMRYLFIFLLLGELLFEVLTNIRIIDIMENNLFGSVDSDDVVLDGDGLDI